MTDFEITEEILLAISRQFNVELKTVKTVYHIFSKVISDVKNQYLAHIIRCMETYLRKLTNNEMFQINCYPLDPKSPVINVGCAQYFPKKYFSVFFHPNMDVKQLRVCLAHELGHLFIIEALNDTKNDTDAYLNKETLTEPLSTIFGIFTIMDKNNFYKDCSQKFNHKTWEDIIQEFIHLQNKTLN